MSRLKESLSFVEMGDDQRLAQEFEGTPTAYPSFAPSSSLAPTGFVLQSPTDGAILFQSLLVFGSVFALSLLLYSFVRTRYPRAYSIRQWSPKCKTALADNLYGYFDWMWQLAWINDEEMREECGLDSLCFIRVFWFGFKISLMGCFNSAYLFPVYGTSSVTDETRHITDTMAQLTIANVPPGSPRFYATVGAAYLTFLFTMWLMLKELKWFTEQRHIWLMEKRPRNYTVYVTGIPAEYQTSAKLMEYFRSCFHHGDVLEARIALNIPDLERKVEHRQRLVAKLEHAINLENIKGIKPVADAPLRLLAPRDAISAYAEELNELNSDIALEKAALLAANDPNELPDQEGDTYSLVFRKSAKLRDATGSSVEGESSMLSSLSGVDAGAPTGVPVVSNVLSGIAEPVTNTVETAGKLANTALHLFVGDEEGHRKGSGFISFSKLSARQAALQMIHNPTPFVMDVFEAPDPDDIFWPNCGRNNEDLQAGMLISISWTVFLCILWTIPTSFIVSLTNVETLAEKISFLKPIIDKYPWVGEMLSVMSPLLLVPLTIVLKVLLRIVTKFEGPISNAVLESSLYTKLSIFQIIQTYLVSIVAGSLSSEFVNAVDNIEDIVTALASSIASQASYFFQVVVVFLSVRLSFELLRVGPLLSAFGRKFLPPKLSEKERNTTIFFGIFRPLSDPWKFEHADLSSQSVLYVMILFGYGSSTPIMNWFLALCFMVLAACHRNQLVYCYPVTDSGGRIFMIFMHIVPICMLIAQICLGVYLALKKAVIPATLMIPLCVITVLFYWYTDQRHYRVLRHLPSRECVKMDNEDRRIGRADLDFLKGTYLQPALRAEDYVQAGNMSLAQEIRITGTTYATPPGSEGELEAIAEEEQEIASRNDGDASVAVGE